MSRKYKRRAHREHEASRIATANSYGCSGQGPDERFSMLNVLIAKHGEARAKALVGRMRVVAGQ